MKPLLIIPPAPARWPALRELPLHDALVWQEDLEKRFAEGIPGSQDAFALVSDGGLALGCAAVSKRHDLGILTRLFVRPEHRERGLARQITESLVSWFDMAGGKWLYATTTADVAEGFFRRFAFSTLRRAPRAPHDAVLLLRATGDVPPDPLSTAVGTLSIHDLSRANWPSLAALLYNRPGPDPRVPLDESAVTAELTALQLLSQQEAGTCQLKAAFHGTRLVGLATIATDCPGERTYGMIVPHVDAPPQLREAIVALARSRGYQHVDFPLEALPTEGAEPATVVPQPEPAPAQPADSPV